VIQSGGALITPSSLGDEDHWPGAHRQFSYSGGSLALSGLHASYAHIYRAQLWVYVLVNKLARAEARLPLKTYDRGAQGRTEQRDHPYAQLLRHAEPPDELVLPVAVDRVDGAVYGEALWVKLRPAPGRPPMELWPWHPANVVIERDSDGTIWYSDMSNRARRYAESDVVHFSSYNPESTMRGLSPLEPLRMTLLNEDAARRATSSFWQRGARPGVALKHPGNLSKPAADRLKDQWDGLAAGADKTGASVVLEEGMKPER
jgi:HK97 family phage portal protein